MNIIERSINTIQTFLSKGHERNIKLKKNIIYSFILKAGSILASLILVPLTIKYVNVTQYGIWLTLSSVIAWLNFFDIGFGNGLKNNLAIALAKNDYIEGKVYVSTSYFLISIISLIILLMFIIANFFLNWSTILNVPKEYSHEISVVVIFVVITFSVQFVLQLINTISTADQNVILPSFCNFIGNVLSLIIIFFLTLNTKGSLFYLCISIGLSPLIVLVIINIFLFNTKYKMISPSFKFIKMEYGYSIMQLGVKFFIVQIGLLFFYNIDNILISNIVGPSAVTTYNIAYKYFGVISMVSAIVMTPFWSAFTEAHSRNDIDWIKNMVKRLRLVCLGVFALSGVMVIISNKVYHFWVGNNIIVPMSLSIVLALYTSFNMYRTIFVYYMNGIGKLNIQLIIIFISGIINIPLGIFLGKLYGATGVILATTLLCFVCGGIEIYQYKRLINGTATGIWNK